MKYKDPITGEYKTLYLKTGDTLPVGTIVSFDGDEIPEGYEEVIGEEARVVISPTEPTTGEEVWIDNTNKKIYTKNDNGGYEEFNNTIVDSGRNDNGSYIKYADGTMICRASKIGITGGAEITFPVPFVSINYQISLSPGYASTPNVTLAWGDKTVSKFNIYTVIGGVETYEKEQSFDYVAIGFWK